MARITLRQLLDHAAEHEYGVPAFNLNNMEQGLAIMAAADATDSPVILQASKGARAYANDIVLAKLIDGLVEIYPHIPVCMHLDHGSDEATCATAIQYGFTSVMMDGSLKADGKTPADYNYNVEITRNVTKMAHWAGVSVEGELGVLGSLESGQGEAEEGGGEAFHGRFLAVRRSARPPKRSNAACGGAPEAPHSSDSFEMTTCSAVHSFAAS